MLDVEELHIVDPSHDATDVVQIAPVPRVSIQAFCETSRLTEIIQQGAADRHMQKAHVKHNMGGAAAAVEAFRNSPTPNVILIEAGNERGALLEHLDALAEFCDAGTKVVVAGKINDITFYRDLLSRGVSEYLVEPFGVIDFVRAISELYASANAEHLGRIIAVYGAKGGVGSSTIAHNTAWSISRGHDVSTVVADLDLGFGTAGLDFNQDPPQGIADAIFAPDRLDSNIVDRLLAKCSEKLSLLAAPATLDRMYDFDESAFDSIIDVLRASVPIIVLDIPHLWTGWSRRLLVGADDVVVVASPDLGNLRNTKNIFDTLRAARPNDEKPRLVLNSVGVPKRPEISVSDFCHAVEVPATAEFAFDPKLFGTAANNGQMIAEVDAASKAAETFNELARAVTGKSEAKKIKRSMFDPILIKLGRKKAS
jgi:pilus assembly protein CpaE